MTDAQKAERFLSEEQLEFIQEEFGHDPDAMSALDDSEFEKLYDMLGDIEVEETLAAGDNEISERGKMAESIVTAIGNELYSVEDDDDKGPDNTAQ
jgi:hypothetical protein